MSTEQNEGGVFPDIVTPFHPEELRVQDLYQAALIDALSRLPKDHPISTEESVRRGLERRFIPYVEEAQTISEQLSLPEYRRFIARFNQDFLNIRKANFECSDGRVELIMIGDPGIDVFHRTPGGFIGARESTSQNNLTPVNPNLIASIISDIEERAESGAPLVLSEKGGNHINSVRPQNGCGALENLIEEGGQEPSIGMSFGGIKEYYEVMGDGFTVLENIARRKGAQAKTFDMTYDMWSKGLIFGLREAHRKFDPQKNLRKNLEDLHNSGDVLMTELITDMFSDDIDEIKPQVIEEMENYAQSEVFIKALEYIVGAEKLDLTDPEQLAVNTILISEVAQRITLKYEEEGFSFIPTHLLDGTTIETRRDLAYTIIRNVVARRLSRVIPGKHDLLEHNEELEVVGPVAPEFNRKTQGFRVAIPSGSINPDDLNLVFDVFKILRHKLDHDGVLPSEEARIILVTEEFDPSCYKKRKNARREFRSVFSTVGHNAASIRSKRKADIETGSLVVIGVIIDPATKKLQRS